MKEFLHEKAILVTGASSGIGYALTEILSKYGCRLFITGRNHERLAALQHKIGANCHFLAADLSRAECAVSMVQSAVDAIGALDGMAHCAGVSLMQPLRYFSETDIQSMLASNLISAFHLMTAFRKKGNHAVESYAVFISSLLAHHGEKSMSEYSACKAGLEGAVRAWALEVAKEGIRVNIVAPGYVETPMLASMQARMPKDTLQCIRGRHPMGFGSPEDVAHAIAFLLSPAAHWITGTTLHVDGGFHAA